MAIINNLLIDQGANFSVTINWQSDDGTYISLANCTANAQLRKSYYSSNSTPFVANISDSANGEIILTLAPHVTGALKPGRYVYDLVVHNNSNNANSYTRLVEGIATIMPGVTR